MQPNKKLCSRAFLTFLFERRTRQPMKRALRLYFHLMRCYNTMAKIQSQSFPLCNGLRGEKGWNILSLMALRLPGPLSLTEINIFPSTLFVFTETIG
jgi:hypothetical protein